MNYLDMLRKQFNDRIELREQRPGVLKLLAPLYHEDGDMIDIFLKPGDGGDTVRVSDFGMTLMRLSYSYELDTENKKRIFHDILSENGVNLDQGSLVMDASLEDLYPAVLQFAQTVAKVSNMQILKRNIIESLFYEMLASFVGTSLSAYGPRARTFPIPDRDELEVDYQFDLRTRPVFLFGVRGQDKARLVAIACLEFMRARLPFRSFVVHRDFESLNRKDRDRITNAVDKQYTSLDDFESNSLRDFEREAA